MAKLSIEQYVLAGNATFTVRSHKSGKSLTFRVRENKNGNFNVYGPNREYIGVIHSESKHFNYSETKSYTNEFAWIWAWRDLENPRFDFLPSTKCCRCGRELTDPESIELGIGPECLEKMNNGE